MRIPNLSADALSLSMRNLLVAGEAPCLFVMLAAAGASLAVAMAQNRGFRLAAGGNRAEVVAAESGAKTQNTSSPRGRWCASANP